MVGMRRASGYGACKVEKIGSPPSADASDLDSRSGNSEVHAVLRYDSGPNGRSRNRRKCFYFFNKSQMIFLVALEKVDFSEDWLQDGIFISFGFTF